MQSDKQPIDDFFREKEAAFLPGDQQLDAHWQQLKTRLSTPGGPTPGKLPAHITRIIKYLGAMVVITVVTLLIVKTARHTSFPKTVSVPVAAPAADTVTHLRPAVQKTVTPAATATVDTAVKSIPTEKHTKKKKKKLPPP